MAKKSPKMKSAWSKKLRALRKKLSLTQVQMADRAGVNARTWISWENSQYVPSLLAQRGLKTIFPDL
jgi:DNA-binding XRE family transcriptional regulator